VAVYAVDLLAVGQKGRKSYVQRYGLRPASGVERGPFEDEEDDGRARASASQLAPSKSEGTLQ
jgi:hypothetical protein